MKTLFRTMVAVLMGAVLVPQAVHAAAPVTYASDPGRTGWYPSQPGLSPSVVTSGTFGKLWEQQLPGEVWTQPIVSDGVVVVGTDTNVVYGLDAATGAVQWSRNLGAPWQAADVQCLAPDQIGVLGTPVIDPDSKTVYFVSKAYASGTSGPAAFEMHAVDLQTGVERPDFPVPIVGSAQNNPGQVFAPTAQMQRPGLLLMDGVVYAGFGGFCDREPFQGWIFGVSTAGQVRTRWVARGGTGTDGAAIWQSGGALASDGPGQILAVTGNGGAIAQPTPGHSPPADLGEAAIRLQVQPDGTLQATDFFSPYDAASLDLTDADFGSGGPMALPDFAFGTVATPHLMVAVGKQGYVYLLNRDDLGGIGQGPSGADKVLARLGPFGGVWSRPTAWPGDGGYVYMPTASNGGVQGAAGLLRVYKYGLDGLGNPTLSLVATSADSWGYGSSSAVVTSDGTTSGSAVMWANWVGGATGGELRAYDPVPVNGRPQLLWSAPVGRPAKWMPPGIANNRVYEATRDGKVMVFGSPVDPMLSGPAVDFGSVEVGQPLTREATLTAERDVTVSQLTSTTSAFALGTPSAQLPVSLHAGDTISVPITFTPSAAGPESSALIATAADGTQFSLGLRGDGQPAEGQLIANTLVLSFGGTRVGGQLVESIVYTNVGGRAVQIGDIALPGGPFSMAGMPAVGSTIAPGQSVSTQATFAPASEGEFEDEVSVDTAGGQVVVGLTGRASQAPVLRITPSSLDFGATPLNTPATSSVTLTNVGGSRLTITKSKPPVLGRFVALDGLDEGTSLEPGETRTLRIRFAPGAIGPAADKWDINADDGLGLRSVTFAGTGSPSVATTSLDAASGVLTVTGTGSGDILSATADATSVEVRGTFQPLTSVAGCTQVSGDTVRCGAGVSKVVMAGWAGNDRLTVDGPLAAEIMGGDGVDYLQGGDRDDRLDGGLGNDILVGGAGNDMADYSMRSAPVKVRLDDGLANDGEAGEGDNVGIDVENVVGGSGDDALTGNATVNLLRGGPGRDVLVGNAGDDVLDGGLGADELWGGPGVDATTYAGRLENLVVTLDGTANDGAFGEGDNLHSDVESVTGGAGDDTLIGSAADNGLAGGAGTDVVDGGLGADRLTGGDGVDTVAYSTRSAAVSVRLDGLANDGEIGEGDNVDVENVVGGSGDDALTGNASANLLRGGPGKDVLVGNAGDDVLDGGLGADEFWGGPGADTATYAGRMENLSLSLDGNAGDGAAAEGDNLHSDIENLTGGAGDDSLIGSASANVLLGSAGADVLDGRAGADVVTGGAGVDTASYSSRSVAVSVRLDGLANDGESGEGDNVDVENLAGGSGDDALTGNASANLLRGGPGKDVLVGNGGDDVLDGGLGADEFWGGLGVDTASYAGRLENLALSLDGNANDGALAEGDNLHSDVENLTGGAGDDTLAGGTADNVLAGGAGSDVVDGGLGADRLTGGDGVDTASYATRSAALSVRLDGVANDGVSGELDSVDVENVVGGSGDDALTGNASANLLRGGPGKDVLVGNGGDDLLEGGLGADEFWGGLGVDTASYAGRLENLALSLDGNANDGALAEGDNLHSDVENLTGGAGNDSLTGNTADNTLVLGAGADTASGLDGADTIAARDGAADSIVCGAGPDAVTADALDAANFDCELVDRG